MITGRRQRGQYTLIIGIFLLIVIIVLTISLYITYRYFKKNIEKSVSKIADATEYVIVPENLTIYNHYTIIDVRGPTDKILAGVAYCINTTATGKTINKLSKIIVKKGEIIPECVSNNTLNITLEYVNEKRQKINICLNQSCYRTLPYIEGTNMTLRNELRILINVYYEGISLYSAILSRKVWNLRKIYNTDLVFIRDIPAYNSIVPKDMIMNIKYMLNNVYNRERSYYYLNETTRYLLTGLGACIGLTNYSISGVYPGKMALMLAQLGNCAVLTRLVISVNSSKTYLNSTLQIARFNATLVRLFSINQILTYYVPYSLLQITPSAECVQIGYNDYECTIYSSPTSVYFELNDTGLGIVPVSLIRAFVNGSLTLDISLETTLLPLLLIPATSDVNVTGSLELGFPILGYIIPVETLKLFDLNIYCEYITLPPEAYCIPSLRIYNYGEDIPFLLYDLFPQWLNLHFSYSGVSSLTVRLHLYNVTILPLR